MKEITITKEYDQIRVDKVVFKVLKYATKGFVYKMYRKKNIVLNNKKITGKELLTTGDVLTFYFHDETFDKFAHGDGVLEETLHQEDTTHINTTKDKEKKNEDSKLKNQVQESLDESLILYEDENLLVYNKPVGVLSQPNGRDDNLIFRYKEYLYKQHIDPSLLDAYGVCNRLDRNTTGVILIGKNAKSLRIINGAISDKKVNKCYHAIVKGKIIKDLELKDYLVKNENRNKVTISSNQSGDFIHTLVKPLKVSKDQNYSLVQVTILTGKSHQIRAHLASIGYPLLGDGKYGDKKTNDIFRKKGIRFQMLHSYLYEFNADMEELPSLSKKRFTAPYFSEMDKLISELF